GTLQNYRRKCQKDASKEDPPNPVPNDKWTSPNQPRHFVVGYAVHGFHHRLCSNGRYHQRGLECICRFCKGSAGPLDHLLQCSALTSSLYDRYKTVCLPQ